jgi:protein-tyrosine phosphatase
MLRPLTADAKKTTMQTFIDIHCHCLPGLDDGPVNRPDALALCRALVDDGIDTVVATPHQLGRFDGRNKAAQVRTAVKVLTRQLQDAGIPLTVLPGADVRVDERIPSLLRDNTVLTLADRGKHLLLELPHDAFIDIEPLLGQLADRRISVIISHPERHPVLAARPEIIAKWSGFGACVQITAGSLLGQFGPAAQQAAGYFLESGFTGIVATDAHDTKHRCPSMKAAFKWITQKLGQDAARRLCIENPKRVIEGKHIEPLSPAVKQSAKADNEK